MKHKVIIVLNTVWNVVNFRENLLKKLLKNNYEIIIVATEDKYVSTIKSLGCRFYNVNFNSRGINIFSELKTFVSLFIVFLRVRPDLFLGFTIKPNIYGSIICRFLNIPMINNITGLGMYLEKNFIVRRLIKFMYKISLSKSHKIFFQNIEDRKFFLENKICDISISDVLPGSGIDLKKFYPINDNYINKISFLLPARMLWAKGVKEYVEASVLIKKKYKNVSFKLLGFVEVENKDAVSINQLNRWNDLGVIEYLGSTRNIKKYLLRSSCIVLPSYYKEGVPRCILEASSLGKPIITTNTPGCRDAVEDNVTGFLCEPKNSYDLFLKIEKFIKLSKVKKIKFGINARKKMENQFDENIVINKYFDIINKIIHHKSKNNRVSL